MESDNVLIDKMPKDTLINIKSKYILQKILHNLTIVKKFEILRYNKKIKEKINININDYKNYSEIEIEIIPIKNKYGKFININKEEEKYFHIYFNNNREEIKRNYLEENEKINEIKIIIDYKVKSFKDLFQECELNECINFKNFERDNIYNMSGMFSYCSSLKKLNISNFNTNNVTNMC